MLRGEPVPSPGLCQKTPAQRAYSAARIGAGVQELADTQFGVVSRSQLLDLGVSGSAISRWTGNGRLQRLHPRVYAVGHRRLQRDGWRMAGLLTAGRGAVLVHWSSLAVRGLASDRSTVHVCAAGRRGAAAAGVRLHRTTLDPSDCEWYDGFPVTTVERSLVDVAADARERQLGQMLDDALRRGLYDHRRMLLTIDRAHGRHGIGRLMTAVARMNESGDLLRSMSERHARDRLVRAGVRRPLVNVPIAKGDGSYYELDLLWPELNLDVEIDGPHHQMPHQRAADAERDAWLRRRGLHVTRIPVERWDTEFGAVVAEIAALVETCVKKRPLSGRQLTEDEGAAAAGE